VKALLEQARACRLCEAHLPLGPKPVLRLSSTVRVLITSQAPGTKAHLGGLPFMDASGDRLRDWLGMTSDEFYDESRLGIMPMGFCYPGVLPPKGKQGGGDRPPRPECAPLWHPQLLPARIHSRTAGMAGSYGQARYLGPGQMTERVRTQPGLPRIFCLPHPSWRTVGWALRNPWFEAETLPALRVAISAAMQ
jgi:uracil-DNA glycosylase